MERGLRAHAGAHWSNEAARLSQELHTLAEQIDKATNTPPPAAAAAPGNTGVMTNAPASVPSTAPATNTTTNAAGAAPESIVI
jgi:hypothetical protein